MPRPGVEASADRSEAAPPPSTLGSTDCRAGSRRVGSSFGRGSDRIVSGQDGPVNFVGHIATGLRVRGDEAEAPFLVGTALPDFAAMGRTRLGAAAGPLGGGIALHHATDQAFHADPWFLDFERELRSAFRADGLGDGAARARDVGPELLLDGALVENPAIANGVATVYEQIAAPHDDVVDLAPVDQHERWRAHLVGVATRLDPFTYDDATIVAQRLHHITAHRPRLAFSDEHVDAVAARLTRDPAAHRVVGDRRARSRCRRGLREVGKSGPHDRPVVRPRPGA